MIKMTKRLLSLAGLVPEGSKAADIGTDHGFLPCYLVKEGISPLAIGVDRHTGPYRAACRTVEACGLTGRVQIRKGDGLTPLRAGEVETVIIAGLGGKTITDILKAAPEVTGSLTTLILQPMSGADAVRSWLVANGWYIRAEDIVLEDKRYYIIIAAGKGKSPALSEAELLYGPVLIHIKQRYLKDILQKDLAALKEIIKQLAKTENEKAARKREECLKRIAVIKETEKCL